MTTTLPPLRSITGSKPSTSVHDRLVTLPGGRPELTLGFEAIRWASKYLVHPNGPSAGKRWEFVRSQVDFLLWFYAVHPDGSWIHRRGVRRLAKGAGKSPMAAVLALIEFCAPVRLKDFDSSAAGGCVGRPVRMPLVQMAAVAESQTQNTMRHVRAMATKGSRVVAEHGLDPGKTVYYKPDGGMLQVITSSTISNEGAETTFLVGDETEHWTESNGGQDFAHMLDRNLAKSGSRMLETCNAWEPGVDSVAESTWDAFVAQEEGRTRGESRILYDARIAPPGVDWADPDELTEALEFVYGDAFWVPIPAIREAIYDPRTPPDLARRFYLNQPVAADDAWTTPQLWSAISRPEVKVGPGEQIVAFFDGSKSGDATALVGCRISDGHVFTLGVWEPDGDGEVVPVADVDARVRWMRDTFEVVGFFADVREWESFAKVSWPAEFGEDELLVWAESKGSKDPQTIAWDMRVHTAQFTRAAELCNAEVAERAFTHDGNPVTSRHVANMRRNINRYGVSVRKESRKSRRKIDAGVCVIGVRMLRQLVLAEVARRPVKRPRSGRVAGF
jgi:hypothetical protein